MSFMLSFMNQGQLDKLGKLAIFAVRKEFRKTPNGFVALNTVTMRTVPNIPLQLIAVPVALMT